MADEKTNSAVAIGSTLSKVESESLLVLGSYCVIGGDDFKVRCKDFLTKKQKTESEAAMLTVYAADLFRGSKKLTNIMNYVQFPTDLPEIKRDPKDTSYCPQLLVLNVMLPLYQPQMIGSKDNGESLHFVLYLIITQEAYDSIVAGKTSPTKLLKTFLQVDATAQKDYEMRGRLKAIPELLNTKDINLGLLKSLVQNYNGKPFLTGPKYHSFIKNERYLEVDVDIHKYVYLAKKHFLRAFG